MDATRYETSVAINASREAIWSVWADVTNWPEWTPTVTRVEALDSAPLALGSRYRIHQPKLRAAAWTVTSLEPLVRFTWESRSLGVKVVADHLLQPAEEEATSVGLCIEFRGFLGVVIGRLYRRLITSYLSTEAASLRRRCERETSA